jgi:uncharacterized protein (TIGR02270 family)
VVDVSARPQRRRPSLAHIVEQHVQEAAFLRLIRARLVRAPHIDVALLARHDERIAAHLDGVRVAGEEGAALVRAAFVESPTDPGAVFALLCGAIEGQDAAAVAAVLPRIERSPPAARGAASAVGWVSGTDLQGLVLPWFDGGEPGARWLALAACATHRVDPGPSLARLLLDSQPWVRARALQAAGELGRRDLIDAARGLLRHDDPQTALLAARTALLLGDRSQALATAHAWALRPWPGQPDAVGLTMLFADPERGRHLAGTLAHGAAGPVQRRLVVKAAGWGGDVRAVPWLLDQMADPALARLAGEAFTTLTGARLDAQQLEALDTPPAVHGEDGEQGAPPVPAEDADLPWPHVGRLRAWWAQAASRLEPGPRRLWGLQVDDSACLDVLRCATQRVRRQAALLRCAQAPGTPLFNVAAPAWRQQRELAQPNPVATLI